MAKVFIGVGHGGKDPGAIGYIVEKEYALKVALLVEKYLKENGVSCMLSRKTDTFLGVNDKARMCNNYNPDLALDIHFNAGGGTGFEVYHSVVGDTSKTLAENVENEVRKIINNRGVKTKSGNSGTDFFGFIRETNAPAILIESVFVDNKSDTDFAKANYEKLAKAYADGILKTLGISNKIENVLDTKGYKKGDNTIGVLSLKELLLLAKKIGISNYGMNKNSVFGDGTENAVNYLLNKWGYTPNGIAGKNFIMHLHTEIEKNI